MPLPGKEEKNRAVVGDAGRCDRASCLRVKGPVRDGGGEMDAVIIDSDGGCGFDGPDAFTCVATALAGGTGKRLSGF